MAKCRPLYACFFAPGVFVYMYHGLLWQLVVCTCGFLAACVAFGLFGAACGALIVIGVRVGCTAACVAMTRVGCTAARPSASVPSATPSTSS